MSSSFKQQHTQPILVSCRIRPYLPHESQARNLISSQEEEIEVGDGVVAINHKTGRHVYNFTSVHGPGSTQLEVFNQDVFPLLEKIYSGVSCTIFSYGVTGSGKTHTMQGDPTSTKDMGIILRVVKAIFEKSDKENLRGAMEVCVEYLEIYKEECYDLFEPWVTRDQRKKLDIRTDDQGQNVVAGLSQVPVSSPADFNALYSRAASRRVTASTKLNAESSRSHAVLTLVVRILEGDKIITGKINLVDLAGSENNKLTGNDKERMIESAKINQSLTTLGNVIDALNTGGPGTRVPYRNSKLTRILQDTLGGNSIGLLICALAPGSAFRQDTINTLNFAQRSKQVESRVVINERDNKPPPPPAHFAAITKTSTFVPLRTGSGADASNPSSSSSTVLPLPIRPMKSIPRMSIATGQRSIFNNTTASTTSNIGGPSHFAPAGKARTVSGGKLRGKTSLGSNSSMIEEQSSLAESDRVKALVQAAVAEALAAQAKAHSFNPAAYEARILNLEKDMQAEKDRAAANELLNEARRYHDAAYAEDDYEQLSYALGAYTRASIYVPGNKNVRNRIQDIQNAIEHNLPIPPRKSVAVTSGPSSSSSVVPGVSHPTRPASAMSEEQSTHHRRTSATLPRAAKKVHLSEEDGDPSDRYASSSNTTSATTTDSNIPSTVNSSTWSRGSKPASGCSTDQDGLRSESSSVAGHRSYVNRPQPSYDDDEEDDEEDEEYEGIERARKNGLPPTTTNERLSKTDLEELERAKAKPGFSMHRWNKIQAAKAWLADHPDPAGSDEDDDLGGYSDTQIGRPVGKARR